MSLADAYADAKKPARRRTRMDEIYDELPPEDRPVLLEMLADPQLKHAAMADALTRIGYRVDATTISKARRDGWEPA